MKYAKTLYTMLILLTSTGLSFGQSDYEPLTVVVSPERDPYPVPLEISAYIINTGVGIHTSANLVQGNSSFWNSAASAALGTGTLVMSNSYRANYETTGLISGTVTLTIGLLGLAEWGVGQYSESEQGLFPTILNDSWNIRVGREPGFIDSATISVGYRF